MKILFSMRHAGALRNFSSTIRALADRGHAIHLTFSVTDRYGDGRLLHELLNEYPAITHHTLTKKRPPRLFLGLARGVRAWVDYLRFLEPAYGSADALRGRAEQRTPAVLVRLSRRVASGPAGRRWLRRLLLAVDAAIPTDAWIDRLVHDERPDVLLVTPLVDLGSDQTEFVKSARALGVPSGLCVHSWDNLTNKGLIRIVPDRVFVWNEAQKREAVEMHDAPADAVVVTGAPVFDQWFERRPSTTRQAFCQKTGLPDDRPYVLYLGSSAFIAPDESAFVVSWLGALRSASDERLRTVAVLIRPHPQNLSSWQQVDLSAFPGVAVWPREGADPVDVASKNDFFDSVHHCAAAVGVNTTALIEVGIQERPVLTVGGEEHAGTQAGTLHFHYLLTEGGGLASHAATLEEHVGQLARALDARPDDRARARGFLRAFVRPFGLEQPATPRLADGIEALGRLARRPWRLPVRLYPLRLALYPLALVHALARLVTGARKGRGLGPMTPGGAVRRAGLAALDRTLEWRPVRGFVKRTVVPRVMGREGPQTAADELAAVQRTIDRLYTGGRPVIVGPWLSELGFEVLYWVPFLQWVKTHWPFEPDRLVVVSRGGVASWYGNVGGRYVDLFDLFAPEELRARNERRVLEGRQKQHEIGELDREIARLVRTTIERSDAEMLHPMLMYRLFNPYWNGQALAGLVDRHASFERLPAPDASMLEGALPERFVAVRFYFNDCFPETEANRAFIRRVLAGLRASSDVVMLNSGLRLDDHVDWDPGDGHRIHTIDGLMTPRNNLHLQSAVISRAQGFVGTYGGLAYLPPFYGVSSVCFFSRTPNVAVQHLELAQRAFARMRRGSFTALDVGSADLLHLAFGDAERLSTVAGGPDAGGVRGLRR